MTHAIGGHRYARPERVHDRDEWAEIANDVFNFVPDGTAVKTIRHVVRTAVCNECHDPLFDTAVRA